MQDVVRSMENAGKKWNPNAVIDRGEVYSRAQMALDV